MRALSLIAARQFEFIDQPEPSSPGPGEAIVRVHAVGVCGTDISGYLGKMPFIQFPRILGHELGVEVVATGEGVTNVAVGARCSVEPYLNCGTCPPCVAGRTNCCEVLEVLGVHCEGGLRPYIQVPARKLHPANDLAYDQLALVETLAIGCHAVNRGAPKADESVLVIGAGPIGLSVIEFVRLTGARLHVVEPNAARRAFVQSNHGLDSVHEPLDAEAFAWANGGRGADVIFDATGHPASMSCCTQYAAFGARLVFVGITSEPVTLNDPLFHRRELSLMATRNAVPADFMRILGLIRDGRIQTSPWITHRARFEDVPATFGGWLRPDSGVVKAMIGM